MDPFTIATTTAGIVKASYMITATIYSFVEDSRNVDSNVDDLLREIQGLSRGAEAIGSTWNKNPMIITAQAGTNGNLWGSVRTTLGDCQTTLARLNSKLDEVKKGSSFGLGFLRKPTKLVMLNMKLKDIVAFKQQIQSYNSAMQSALLMINVCLSLNSNSSQENVMEILNGLKNQIGHLRMETSRQGATVPPEMAQDNKRMTQNLQSLIQQAEALHSSASTVVGDDRSTVWGGSVLGEPLNADKYSSIKNWIPPPAISEEMEITEKPESSSSFLDSALGDDQTLDQDSDADSDIEIHLLKRYKEVAMASFKKRDYSKAESFFRKVLEMNTDVGFSEDEMRETKVMLGYSYALQRKWEEAKDALVPITMEKGLSDAMSFHGLHAFALVYFALGHPETATTWCKPAIGGFKKILGKSSDEYYTSMFLLAHIYDQIGDSVSAEGCRTFVPASYDARIEMDPVKYLEGVFFKATEESSQQISSSTLSLARPETQLTSTPRSISTNQTKSSFLAPDAAGPIHSRSRSVESLTNTVRQLDLDTELRRSNSVTPSQPSNVQKMQKSGSNVAESSSQSRTDNAYNSSNVRPPTNNLNVALAKSTWIPSIRLSFITAQDQTKIESLFRKVVQDGSTISGVQTRELIALSKLDGHTLAQIWTLADTSKSGKLYFPEFALAMYMCNQKIVGKQLPLLPDYIKREVIRFKELITSHVSESSLVSEASKLPVPVSTIPSQQDKSSFRKLVAPSPPLKQAKIVVAVDFGASDSAVAWGFTPSGGREIYGQYQNSVEVLAHWPHSSVEVRASWPQPSHSTGFTPSKRVPTVLYYDQDSQVVGWGFDVLNAMASNGFPKPGVLKLQWFKFHLMVEGNSYIDPVNLPALPPGKGAVEVVADFLSQAHQAIRQNLANALKDVFFREESNIHYCFTLPYIWNEATKASLLRASKQAGFLGDDENESRCSFIGEGEAAAIASMSAGLLHLEPNEVVLVVGCGMGTVDLIAYKLEKASPCSFVEFTVPTGDSCGSTAINRNFSNIVRDRIRKMKSPDFTVSPKKTGKVYAKSVLDFEGRIKKDFMNNGQKWAVDVALDEDFPKAKIEGGCMAFTNDEILSCFEPIINCILKLLLNQIMACEALNGSLKNILLVGPFSNNEYLFQQIRWQCGSKVVRPTGSETIAVRGAVIAARERCNIPPIIDMSLGIEPCSIKNYALKIPVITRSESHMVSEACKTHHCLDGVDRRSDTALIFLRKNQPLSNFQGLRFTVTKFVGSGDTLQFSHPIFTTDVPMLDNEMVLFDQSEVSETIFKGDIVDTLRTKITYRQLGIKLDGGPIRKFHSESGVYYMVEYDITLEVYMPTVSDCLPILAIKSFFGAHELNTVQIEIETGKPTTSS